MAVIPVDGAEARVYEHGWQSWSPSTTYPVGERPLRPVSDRNRVMNWRPDATYVDGAFQGEGLLVIQPGRTEPVHVFATDDARTAVPTIRARRDGASLVVDATGPVRHTVDIGPDGIDGALARWADGFATTMGVQGIRRAPTIWCSWYHYFVNVHEDDIVENMDEAERLGLPVEVIQIDDGYQAGYGDWLVDSDRFGSTATLVRRIRERGFRAGIWTAPFTVGARSILAREHPDWLVGGPDAPVSSGENWGQDLFCLDTTHPGAQAYLTRVYTTMREWGIDFHKIDFIYAGAIPGRRHVDATATEAFRLGLDVIRAAVGEDAYLLGCGAPILPSVGTVDAMRISCDTHHDYEPEGGDLSMPSSRGAMITGAGRAFTQGRFWINDPDCLIVEPGVERREAWAAHVERYGGLRGSSDRLRDLDAWGLETTRRLLAHSPTETFVPS